MDDIAAAIAKIKENAGELSISTILLKCKKDAKE